jgi:hypothetical protein
LLIRLEGVQQAVLLFGEQALGIELSASRRSRSFGVATLVGTLTPGRSTDWAKRGAQARRRAGTTEQDRLNGVMRAHLPFRGTRGERPPGGE